MRAILFFVVSSLLVGCQSTGGSHSLASVFSPKNITIGGVPYKWEVNKIGAVNTEFRYESPEEIRENELNMAKAELRAVNPIKNVKGRFVVTVISPSIDSVSYESTKVFLVQDGVKVFERSVSGVASYSSSDRGWWNLVLLPLNDIDLDKDFEVRAMYTFDSNYTSLRFSPVISPVD